MRIEGSASSLENLPVSQFPILNLAMPQGKKAPLGGEGRRNKVATGTENLLHDGLNITRRSLGMTTNRR
jgi:hypothetical protein